MTISCFKVVIVGRIGGSAVGYSSAQRETAAGGAEGHVGDKYCRGQTYSYHTRRWTFKVFSNSWC